VNTCLQYGLRALGDPTRLTVLVYEPPRKLVLGWHLQANFQYNPDPALASEVVFEFIAEGPEATRVEFRHWHLERHGAGWEKLPASVDSDWTEVLAPYERATLAAACLPRGGEVGARSYAGRYVPGD